MGGNPLRLYRQALSPWAVAPRGCKRGVKQLVLKGTREARCKPPRGGAWLRTHTVSKRRCATKRIDTMEGNSRRLYQGGCEPLGRSGSWMQAGREIAALKRYRCGRGKLPRCRAWLRDGMATQKEGDFNLRENSPLAQYLAQWASERTERLPRLVTLCCQPKG
jgi:hypothetical protein